MNPFMTVWFRPRRTIRSIADQNPKSLVVFLAVLAGAAEVGMQGANIAARVNTPLLPTVIFSAVLGSFLGLIGLYFFGLLYRWVGSWFGGQATGVEVRAAIAWAKVPTFVIFVIWLVTYFLTKDALAVLREAPTQMSAGTIALLVGQGVATLWFGLWGFIMLCLMLGEVHRFSGWKGLLTVLIPSIFMITAVFILSVLAAIAIPNFPGAREPVPLAQQAPLAAQAPALDEEWDEEWIEPYAEEPLPLETDEPEAEVSEVTSPRTADESLQSFRLVSGETIQGRVTFEGDVYLRVQLADGTQRIIFRDELVEE